MRVKFVLLIKVATEHLRGLVHGVLNLDCHATSRLGLLYNLDNSVSGGEREKRWIILTSIAL